MKVLHNLLESVKPNFTKGGKLEKFHPAFDAFETFLFTPAMTTSTGAHIRDAIDLKRTMFTVVIAMVPCLLFGMWNVGYQHFAAIGQPSDWLANVLFGAVKVVPIVVVSYAVGLGIEFAIAIKNNHSVNEGYLVSGMLIPLVMPATIPLWMVAVATAFAVVIGKEVFGGTGMNILNPALTARAFVFFAYPAQISGDKVWIATDGLKTVDGYSGATALGQLALDGKIHDAQISYSLMDMFIGTIPGSIGETSKLAILLGAAILLVTGIASWRIMLSAVLGGLGMGYIFNLVAPGISSPAMSGYMATPFYQHLLMGGFLFGVVFMATDPVSAAQTNTGKWIYGFLIGVFAILIRVFNPAYPEGIMLAILLMNVFAPLIDHYVVEANINRRLKRVQAAA
jgi:Na+-transporting NADH:ubiquinone oxidoreductase subunit B